MSALPYEGAVVGALTWADAWMPEKKNQKKPLITTIWFRPTPTEYWLRGICAPG